jgi:CDGSH-type Zn-finger protein
MGAMGEGVVIKVRDDGPYKVTGPVTIIDVDGNAWALPEGSVVLCRCGASRSKPFCDGSHKDIGFTSRIRTDDSGTSPGTARSRG